MIKHVGNHNGKKVFIVYKQVPGEDHMCLVAYSEVMARLYHDSVIQTLESAAGQAAKELADALFRAVLPDGRNSLHTLHQEGLLKKVPTNQVTVTPTPRSSVRLDELNDILGKMEQGEEAVNKLAKLDSEAGMTGKRKRTEPVNNKTSASVEKPLSVEPAADVPEVFEPALTDEDISVDLKHQSIVMRNNAHALMLEADRLAEESAALEAKIAKSKETTNSTQTASVSDKKTAKSASKKSKSTKV